MPYCTSCGKEISPDKKFCTECGEPVEPCAESIEYLPLEHAPFILPSDEQPPKKQLPKKILIFVAVIVVIALAAFYVVGLPMITGAGSSSNVTPVPTKLQTVTTPVRTYEPVVTVKYPNPVQTPVSAMKTMVQNERSDGTYLQIYNNQRKYDFGAKEIVTRNITNPPMYIHFDVIPRMVERDILVSIGTSAEHMVNSSFPDPTAWFEVKVINIDSGGVVDSRGFNREYSITTDQEFMIMKSGNYRVEMSGNGVTADVQISIGRS